ncbi:uncharacterized protein PHALS_05591 [Plasmopara halstedii]|uniref:Uncharacterized protein n=1 Tax=Plasmopara halstedii TaxID=4781 RepID=A0A0P1B138_PLAHL|nr:uncharacterized protein PHALS_05591 [Plasmopara halstedii]CEG48117.1 hypothetical protein PHALS_05591 [Plasmopara halstedii]|eukprot:XP_024584486.1 hypothetical protein PHALS_05591 [Plasmopara halstedii]
MPRKPIHYIKKLWSRLSSFREDFVQCNKRYYAPPIPARGTRVNVGHYCSVENSRQWPRSPSCEEW